MNKAKGIMRQKVETYIQQSTDSKPEEFLKTLQFTDAEINHVEDMESDLVQNSSAKNLSVSTNLDQHQPLFYNTFNKLNQHQ